VIRNKIERKIIMRVFFILIILLPSLLIAQYWGERTTEQSFEQSELYFNNHFLNTYGIYQFKDVAPGLIDDPFLNLYINPANFQYSDSSYTLLYLDFRGDRTEEPILKNGIYPLFGYRDLYYPYIAPDPRWLSQTRSEPEPIVSFGLLTTPLSEVTNKLVLGFTYQLIHKEEPYYTVPYSIYNSRYGYDSFGGYIESSFDNVPVEDRYSGADEMSNEGHLYSAYLGYQVSEDLSLGLGLNGVMHIRDGMYGDSYNDEFGDTDNRQWRNSSLQERTQEYDHFDLNVGINYKLTHKLKVGVKAGQLYGEANQKYVSTRSYFSQNNTPNVSDEWSYYFSDAITNQNWKHKGDTKYIGFNFKRKINDSKTLSGYYRYSYSDIDMTTTSSITDTSHNNSRWISSWDSTIHDYMGQSLTSDIRTSGGKRKKYIYQAMINYKWKLTPATTISAGIYAYKNDTEVEISEPALVRRYSEYQHDTSGVNRYWYLRELKEDKQLEWRYKSKKWSLQIPVILNFNLTEHWGMMLGVNRILESWRIEDQTTAYFNYREKNENGVIQTETNFGERYTQPTEKISEDYTDVIAGFNVTVASEFKIRLLIDPEFENEFRIAQWWLGFEARL
jgi:hypothetical protein